MYKIVWHFDGTTLSSVYDDEETMEKCWEKIQKNLSKGVKWHAIGDTVINSENVLCISMGKDDEEWKSVKSH